MNIRPAGVLCLACLVLFGTGIGRTQSPDLTDHLRGVLSKTSVARFRFREVKHLRSLQQPLRSRGFMIYARERGLYRRITEPIVQEQLITPEGVLVERSASGDTQRLRLSAGGGRKMVTSVFSIFSGHFDALRQRGRLTLSGDTGSWSLTYDLNENRFPLKTVSMRGSGRTLRGMSMLYDGGDSTVTTFSEVEFKDRLSRREAQLFGSLEGD